MSTSYQKAGEQRPSFLIVHTRGIGDWMMFTPTLRAIKEALPESRIDVLLGTPATLQVVRHFKEVSDTFIANVRSDLRGLLMVGYKARCRRYDILLVTDGVRQWKAQLFGLLVGAKRSLLPLLPRDPRDNSACHDRHRVFRNFHALDELGIDRPTDTYPRLANLWGAAVPGSVMIHPGSDSKYKFKRWPVDRFISLATELGRAGRKVTVVIGPSEMDLAGQFVEATRGTSINLCLNRTFEEVLSQIASHETCLTSDSGLGHVAAALDRKVVTIFGPADLAVIKPHTNSGVTIRTDDAKLTCMPCMRPGGRMGCSERPCLMQIGTRRVLEAISFGQPANT